MSLLKYLFQRKQPNYILSAFRITAGLSRYGSIQYISPYSSFHSNAGRTGSATVLKKSDAVSIICQQVKDCMKGQATQEDVLGSYSIYKRNGELSEGDNVRILFRMTKMSQGIPKVDGNIIEKVFEILMEDITSKKTQLAPFQVANVFWSLGKLRINDLQMFDQFGRLLETTTDFSGFKNRDMAMILWAHGRASIASPLVFNILLKEILNRGLKSFTMMDICQIVWSFAKVGGESASLFAAAREEIEERDISEFSNLDIYMLLRSFSEAGNNVESLFNFMKFGLLTSSRLPEYTGIQLSTILWSFANQNIKALDLFTAIEREFLKRPNLNLNEQSLVDIAWSYAHTDNKSPVIFRLVEEKMISGKLQNLSLQRLVRILWAFTKSGFLHHKMLNRVTSAMADHNFHELSQDSLEEMVFILQNCHLKISPELTSCVELELTRRAEST